MLRLRSVAARGLVDMRSSRVVFIGIRPGKPVRDRRCPATVSWASRESRGARRVRRPGESMEPKELSREREASGVFSVTTAGAVLPRRRSSLLATSIPIREASARLGDVGRTEQIAIFIRCDRGASGSSCGVVCSFDSGSRGDRRFDLVICVAGGDGAWRLGARLSRCGDRRRCRTRRRARWRGRRRWCRVDTCAAAVGTAAIGTAAGGSQAASPR